MNTEDKLLAEEEEPREVSKCWSFYPEGICRTRQTWDSVFKAWESTVHSPAPSQGGKSKASYLQQSWDF
jgi:hypothetical protein